MTELIRHLVANIETEDQARIRKLEKKVAEQGKELTWVYIIVSIHILSHIIKMIA